MELYAGIGLHANNNYLGVVVESTFNWYWLVDGLMDHGYRVHLANPAAIQQYEGLKHVDDQRDALWLANLLRLGILPEGYIYLKQDRPVRDLLRKRLQLVRHRTSHILSIKNIVSRTLGISYHYHHITVKLSGGFGCPLERFVSLPRALFRVHQFIVKDSIERRGVPIKSWRIRCNIDISKGPDCVTLFLETGGNLWHRCVK